MKKDLQIKRELAVKKSRGEALKGKAKDRQKQERMARCPLVSKKHRKDPPLEK